MKCWWKCKAVVMTVAQTISRPVPPLVAPQNHSHCEPCVRPVPRPAHSHLWGKLRLQLMSGTFCRISTMSLWKTTRRLNRCSYRSNFTSGHIIVRCSSSSATLVDPLSRRAELDRLEIEAYPTFQKSEKLLSVRDFRQTYEHTFANN